jgi:hypothetical protein
MRHEGYVLEPVDTPYQAQPSCQRRVQAISGNNQSGAYSDLLLCLHALYAAYPLALKKWLPHPQARPEFHALSTRLLHQDIV